MRQDCTLLCKCPNLLCSQAKGRLRAIGTALHLKQRFGAGYQVQTRSDHCFGQGQC